MDEDWKQRFFPISSWGSFHNAEDIKNLEDKNEVEKFINEEVYLPMSEDLKIRSIYSPLLVSNDEDQGSTHQGRSVLGAVRGSLMKTKFQFIK